MMQTTGKSLGRTAWVVLWASLWLYGTAGGAWGEILYSINLAGTTNSWLTPNPAYQTAVGINGGSLQAAPTVQSDGIGTADNWAWWDWSPGLVPDEAEYLEFSFSPAPNYEVVLDSLDCSVFREFMGTGGGPDSFELRLIDDGFNTFTTVFSDNGLPLGIMDYTGGGGISLAGALGTITFPQTVTFRWYFFNPEDTDAAVGLAKNGADGDADLVVNGTLTFIPEPAHTSLALGLAAFLVLLLRRKKRCG